MHEPEQMMERGVTRRAVLGSVGAAAMFPPLAQATLASLPASTRPVLEAWLQTGAPQSGQYGRRHARVHGGAVTGSLMRGTVQSGRLDWLVDPASGAVEVTARVQVLSADGALIELRDRTAPAVAAGFAAQPGWPTAPELFEAASGKSVTDQPLAGRLDTAAIARGLVRLRAFIAA